MRLLAQSLCSQVLSGIELRVGRIVLRQLPASSRKHPPAPGPDVQGEIGLNQRVAGGPIPIRIRTARRVGPRRCRVRAVRVASAAWRP